jgi:TP901 family phage tail tape measure protein
MPDNEDIVNRLIFDIGNSGQAFDELERVLKEYNSNLDNVISVTTKFNEETGSTDFVIKAFTDNLRKLGFSLNSTEEGYKAVNIAAEDNARINQQAAELYQQKADAMQEAAALEAQFASALNKSNVERQEEARLTSEGIKLQELLDKETRKLADAERRRIEQQAKKDEKEFAKFLRDEASAAEQLREETTRLAKAQADLNRELAEARTLGRTQASNASAADVVGSTIAGNLKAGPRATAEEINNQALAISRFAKYVEDGQVSAKRAFEIFSSVSKGTGEIFQKSEVQVAQAAQGILTANGKLEESYADEVKRLTLLGKGFKKAGDDGKESALKISISWESLVRFFATHIIYTQFNKLISAFKEGTETALKLSLQVAEIQTISQKAQLSTEEWTSSIRKLSDEFDRPIGDVASGVYETLSNQIAKGADSAKFLREALQFAQVTMASTEDSVNLLSSAINSYNIPADRAGEISAKFFKIIDLGRVHASEMANTFGRVAQLTSALGISFDETGAAITTLTRQGVKYNEAFTLINNIATKLLKPTVPLLKVFQEWGVANGEAAIATFGFAGTLKKLEEAADGSDSELAAMFKDIRAVRGVLGLTGSAFKDFAHDLGEIKGASNEYSKAIEEVQRSTGFQLQKQLNEVKNFFAVDVGTKFTGTLLEASKTFGTLKENTQNFLTIAKIGIETFVIYKGVTLGAKIATELYNTSLGIFNLSLIRTNTLTGAQVIAFKELKASLATQLPAIALVGVVALYETIERKAEEVSKAREEAFTRLQEQSAKEADLENKVRDQETANFKDSLNKRFSALISYDSRVLEENQKLVDSISESYDKIADNLKNALDSAYDSSKKSFNDAKRDAEDAAKDILRINKEIENAKADLKDKQFKLEFDQAGPLEQVNLLGKRYDELTKQIADAQKKINVDNIDEQKAAIQKMYGEQVQTQQQLAERKGKLAKEIADLEEQLSERNANTSRQADIVAQQNKLAELRLKEKAHTLTNKEAEALRQLKEAAAQANDAQKTEDVAKKLADKKAEIDAINGLTDTNKNLEATYKSQEGFLQNLIKLEEERKKNAEDAAKKAEEDFRHQKDAITDIAKFSITDKSTGQLKFKTVEEAVAAFDKIKEAAINAGLRSPELIQKYAEQEVAIADKYNAIKNQSELKSIQDKLNKEKEAILNQRNELDKNSRDTGSKETEDSNKILALVEQLKKASESGLFNGNNLSGTTTTDLDILTQAINRFKTSGSSDELDLMYKKIVDFVNTAESENLLSGLPGGALGIDDADGKSKPLREVMKEIQILIANIDFYHSKSKTSSDLLKSYDEQIKTLDESLAKLTTSQKDLYNVIAEEIPKSIEDMIKDTERLIKRIDELRGKTGQPTSQPSTQPTPHFAGGYIPGYGARGGDTMPAMIDPREFVINPDASAKFRTLLVAMNTGKPISSTGGSGITMGDVNVTIQSSGNEKYDALQVGKEIRNHIRTGKLRW